jgi:hypothetical protein
LKTVNSSAPVGGFGDVSTWQGAITLIEPDTVLFEPNTMAFVPASLVEEFRGTIVGDGLTVVESRSGLPDAGLRALYRRQ